MEVGVGRSLSVGSLRGVVTAAALQLAGRHNVVMCRKYNEVEQVIARLLALLKRDLKPQTFYFFSQRLIVLWMKISFLIFDF